MIFGNTLAYLTVRYANRTFVVLLWSHTHTSDFLSDSFQHIYNDDNIATFTDFFVTTFIIVSSIKMCSSYMFTLYSCIPLSEFKPEPQHRSASTRVLLPGLQYILVKSFELFAGWLQSAKFPNNFNGKSSFKVSPSIGQCFCFHSHYHLVWGFVCFLNFC